MKAKNQQPVNSENDAKEKLIVYVYEYLFHCGAKQAANSFKESMNYTRDIKVNEGPGFLVDWWCVFWDLYCAAPDRRLTHPESSMDARAFHDYRGAPMSPSITHPSPPQHPSQGPAHGHHFMGGPRMGYGPQPTASQGPPQIRGPPPRMQGPLQHPGGPHHGGPGGFMASSSPRYATHPGAPPQPHAPPHMNQGPPGGAMFGPGPDQMGGPSPGMNRMTPIGGPPLTPNQQVVGGPPLPSNGHPSQMIGMSNQGSQHLMGGPSGGPMGGSQMNPMQIPPRNGSQGSSQGSAGGSGSGSGGGGGNGWSQGNVNYSNVNSPANQQCYNPNGPGSNQPGPQMSMMSDVGMMDVKNSPISGGPVGEPSTPHSDDFVLPVPFGQDTEDQCDSAEMMKMKHDDSSKMFDKDQGDFGISDPFPDGQGWK